MNEQVQELSALLREKSMMLVTAESCTGGMIAAAMTDLAGSSSVFDRGFVTYSNAAKCAQLAVPSDILELHGAVSVECARAMALGALEHSDAQIAVSVTGVAGPDGGSVEKPVGLVYIGVAAQGGEVQVTECHFAGDRADVRAQTVERALSLLVEAAASV